MKNNDFFEGHAGAPEAKYDVKTYAVSSSNISQNKKYYIFWEEI